MGSCQETFRTKWLRFSLKHVYAVACAIGAGLISHTLVNDLTDSRMSSMLFIGHEAMVWVGSTLFELAGLLQLLNVNKVLFVYLNNMLAHLTNRKYENYCSRFKGGPVVRSLVPCRYCRHIMNSIRSTQTYERDLFTTVSWNVTIFLTFSTWVTSITV